MLPAWRTAPLCVRLDAPSLEKIDGRGGFAGLVRSVVCLCATRKSSREQGLENEIDARLSSIGQVIRLGYRPGAVHEIKSGISIGTQHAKVRMV